MIVLAGGWAYAGVALRGGSVVQAVFVVLVAPEVEQGSLTPALSTVPVLMVVAAAAFVLGRFLCGRAQQSHESGDA